MKFEKKLLVEVLDSDIKDGTFTIHPKIKRIDNMAFLGCSTLTHITIPQTVKMIGYMAFEGCVNLKSIKYGDSEFTHACQQGGCLNCKSKATCFAKQMKDERQKEETK